jgi:hypothetical protein
MIGVSSRGSERFSDGIPSINGHPEHHIDRPRAIGGVEPLLTRQRSREENRRRIRFRLEGSAFETASLRQRILRQRILRKQDIVRVCLKPRMSRKAVKAGKQRG